MIKVIMNNGEEYELNLKDVDEFNEKYLDGNSSIENRMVKIKEGVSINLMAISSIEEEKYINGINTIMP